MASGVRRRLYLGGRRRKGEFYIYRAPETCEASCPPRPPRARSSQHRQASPAPRPQVRGFGSSASHSAEQSLSKHPLLTRSSDSHRLSPASQARAVGVRLVRARLAAAAPEGPAAGCGDARGGAPGLARGPPALRRASVAKLGVKTPRCMRRLRPARPPSCAADLRLGRWPVLHAFGRAGPFRGPLSSEDAPGRPSAPPDHVPLRRFLVTPSFVAPAPRDVPRRGFGRHAHLGIVLCSPQVPVSPGRGRLPPPPMSLCGENKGERKKGRR